MNSIGKLVQAGFAAFCLLASASALAQPSGPWSWTVDAAAVHQPDAGLEDVQGKVSVSRAFVQPSLNYSWDRRNSLSLSIGAGTSNYEFSNGATIEGAQPWRDIRDFRISVPIRFSAFDKGDVILIPSVRSYAEKGASLDDGRTEGLFAAAGWRFSDRLTLGPGFGWFSELDGGSTLFPIVLINWKVTDRLSISTGGGLAATQGPGITMEYRFSDKWQLGLSGRYERVEFALDDSGPARGGIGEDTSLPLLLTLTRTLWPMTTVSVLAGLEFDGEMSIESNNSPRFLKSKVETAPVFGVSFSTRF
tara:strand:+ start:40895 stop:41809 length:915 start_codon:yes stop_codon:yes gene_type:complete